MAEIIQKQLVRKNFSEEELAELKSYFFEKSEKLEALIEQFDEVASDYKDRIKTAKLDLKVMMKEISHGGVDETIDMRGIPDYENRKMEFFDLDTGEQYHQFTRPLHPSEKEMQINELPQMRKVQNG